MIVEDTRRQDRRKTETRSETLDITRNDSDYQEEYMNTKMCEIKLREMCC